MDPQIPAELLAVNGIVMAWGTVELALLANRGHTAIAVMTLAFATVMQFRESWRIAHGFYEEESDQ